MTSRIDTLISKCRSWDEFVEMANSQAKTKDKGDLFERLTQVYLQTAPTYGAKLENVYLLSDKAMPERLRNKLNLPDNDEGIDLICETRSGEYWSVQCKYKSDQSSALTHKELSTFTSLSFNTCKGISLGLVVHTATKPVRKSQLMPNVTEVGLEKWLEISDADWKRIIKVCRSNKLAPPKKREPRKHQKAAIANAKKHFINKKQKRGKLIMPCGTGKSLTAYWIAQALGANSIIVAVPSLALVRQSLADWTAEYLAEGQIPEWLAVCSDVSVGSTNDADSTVATVYETGIPTNPTDEELDTFLTKRSKAPKIVFTTYQSADKLCEAANRTNKMFDLMIADEAHKTVGRRNKSFATLLFDENIKVKKRLFMTATERVYNASKDDVVSMDDPDIYGSTCHQLSFKEAIKQKIICDYKIVTIAVSDTEIDALIREKAELAVSAGNKTIETDAHSLAAGIAMQKAFKKYGIKHAVTFHGNITRAKAFKRQQEDLPNNAHISHSHISSKLSAGQRAKMLKSFAEEDRSLITNARCLTEGVDIKAIDCVSFVDPKQSTVDIVQAAGRAMRHSPETNKDFGYIVLPITISKGERLEDLAKTDKFKSIIKVITSLSIQDERLVEELKTPTTQKRRKTSTIIHVDEVIEQLLQTDFERINQTLRLVIWQRVGKANWLPFEDARSYVQSLRLKNQKSWKQFLKNGNLPPNVPRSPNLVYATSGWKGFGDWLGTYVVRDKDFWPFEKALNFVRKLSLKSHAEWVAYTKSSDRNQNIPANPDSYYRNKGWLGYKYWLGTGHSHGFRTFEEARKFARDLKLSSSTDWVQFTRSPDFPSDIPKAPAQKYKNEGWLGFADWLGTNRLRKGEAYWPYKKAREFIHALNFKNESEWREYSKSEAKPRQIPASPANVYKEWVGAADWIGRSNPAKGYKDWLPYEDARAIVHALGLKNTKQWREYKNSSEFDLSLPRNPPGAYKGKGWKGFGDWLGTGTIAPSKRQYRPFEEARKFAQSLGLASNMEWRKFTKTSQLPEDIPAAPHRTYSDTGWQGYGDWLGTGNKGPTDYNWRTFEEARKFVRALGLRGEKQWRKYASSGERPTDIPYAADAVYKEIGWSGWVDFLGYTYDPKSEWRSFEEARAYVRSLGLEGFKGWRKYASSGERPADIPSAPEDHYRGQGWAGHSDWTGYKPKKTGSKSK